MNTSFSIGEMLSQGWNTFKKHWKFIILAGIVTMVINLILRGVQNLAPHKGLVLAIIFTVVIIVISIIIKLGWTQVLLQLNRVDTAILSTFKTQPSVWLRYVKVCIWSFLYFIGYGVLITIPFTILIGIGFFAQVGWLTTLGAILSSTAFVVFAIYFSIRYQFLTYATLDYPELRSRAIFKKAGALTKGSLLHLFGFGVVLGLVNLLGLICLVIGLAATIPTTRLAHARVYDYLKNKSTAPEVVS